MTFDVFNRTITIMVNPLPTWWLARQALAREIDRNAERDHVGIDLKIARIKALKCLRGCGLVTAKEWVETAFKDKGMGGIR